MIVIQKMVQTIIFLGFLFSGMTLNSQPAYAPFMGEDINGKKVYFPDCLGEKKTLVGFAFSQKSQNALESWIEPVYYELMDPESLASLVYDVSVFLVIVFNSSTVQYKNRVRKNMKDNLLPELYDNVILSESSATSIKKDFGIEGNDKLTLITFDMAGNVTSKTEGFYSEDKFDDMSAHLEIE